MTPAELLGLWIPIRAEHDGMLAPAMALQKMDLRIRETSYRIRFGRETSDEGTLSVLESPADLQLTLTATRGENPGRVVAAIAQVRGDRLRVCFGMNGILPDGYGTTPGSARYLVTYRRSPDSE